MRRVLGTPRLGGSVSSDSAELPSATETELTLLSPGTRFCERYQVVRCVAAGGMGAVYEVMHQATERRRMMKTMLPGVLADPDMRARFKLEATVTAGIESEHIVEVFDAGIDDSTQLPFLVMEYLRGENLAVSLQRRGKLPKEEVVLLLHQASLALERTHAVGIVHRDLKPENLFVTRRDDGSIRLKILDFGIAKIVSQSANVKTTRSFGTPLYMAPEQVRGDGDIDGRADLYALGQLAFTLLVGHPYWEPEAESSTGVYALLLKVAAGIEERASVRAAAFGHVLDAAFDAWFAHAAHPEIARRFESASVLVDELAAVLQVEIPRPVTMTVASAPRPMAAGPVPGGELLAPTLDGVSDLDKRSVVGRVAPVSGRAWIGIGIAVGVVLGVGSWVAHRTPSSRLAQASVVPVSAESRPLTAPTAAASAQARESAEAPTSSTASASSGKNAGSSLQSAHLAFGAGGAPRAPASVSEPKSSNPVTREKGRKVVTTAAKIDYDPSDLR